MSQHPFEKPLSTMPKLLDIFAPQNYSTPQEIQYLLAQYGLKTTTQVCHFLTSEAGKELKAVILKNVQIIEEQKQVMAEMAKMATLEEREKLSSVFREREQAHKHAERVLSEITADIDKRLQENVVLQKEQQTAADPREKNDEGVTIILKDFEEIIRNTKTALEARKREKDALDEKLKPVYERTQAINERHAFYTNELKAINEEVNGSDLETMKTKINDLSEKIEKRQVDTIDRHNKTEYTDEELRVRVKEEQRLTLQMGALRDRCDVLEGKKKCYDVNGATTDSSGNAISYEAAEYIIPSDHELTRTVNGNLCLKKNGKDMSEADGEAYFLKMRPKLLNLTPLIDEYKRGQKELQQQNLTPEQRDQLADAERLQQEIDTMENEIKVLSAERQTVLD